MNSNTTYPRVVSAASNRNAIALSEQITRLQNNPDELDSMKTAGQTYIANTATWQQRAEQFDQALEKTVNL